MKRLLYQDMVIFNRSNQAFAKLEYLLSVVGQKKQEPSELCIL